MKYQRVIPRDLFNEAKLLKCLGQLCLIIEDRQLTKVKYIHDTQNELGFKIGQNPSDGSFSCSNLYFFVEGLKEVYFFTVQSKDNPYPLYMYVPEQDEDYAVLDEHGELTPEVAKLFGTTAEIKPKLGQKYAKVAWVWDDVTSLGAWEDRNLHPDDAEEFLQSHERIIQDRMVETGWQVIEDLLGMWEGPQPNRERSAHGSEKIPARPGDTPS